MEGGQAQCPRHFPGTHGGARGCGPAANSPASNSQTVINSSAQAIVNVWRIQPEFNLLLFQQELKLGWQEKGRKHPNDYIKPDHYYHRSGSQGHVENDRHDVTKENRERMER